MTEEYIWIDHVFTDEELAKPCIKSYCSHSLRDHCPDDKYTRSNRGGCRKCALKGITCGRYVDSRPLPLEAEMFRVLI